jgi:hypothetical protein
LIPKLAHALSLLVLLSTSLDLPSRQAFAQGTNPANHNPQDEVDTTPASTALAPLALERGPGLANYHAPRGEELTYRVHVDVAMLEAAIGTVTMTSTVEPYRAGVLGGGDEQAEGLEIAVYRCKVNGDYTLYSMDATIETRVLPQDEPRLTYRYTHTGTERRRRELQLSKSEGGMSSAYRRDTSKGAPKGKRIWKKREVREVPVGSLDMLSAVYFSRELVQRDLASLSFPLIDKDRVWQMTLTRGKERRLKLPMGTYEAVEVVLAPSVYPGEDIDSEKVEKFEGLFGIQGSIHMWVERNTGVPIRIQGDFPAGPLTLGVDIVLASATGTPESFQAVQ